MGKIATEKDAKIVDELKQFLINKGHPIVKRWKAKEEEAAVAAVEKPTEEARLTPAPEISAYPVSVMAAGGFKLILKNAKIHAKRVRIIRVKEK
jgi:acetyl-CoA decarbonylase/synthase complex subunit beta